jgi:uncharacterized protein (DUF2267 family)
MAMTREKPAKPAKPAEVPTSARPHPTATDAAAYLVSLAFGEGTLSQGQACDLLRHRLQALRDPTAPEALAELAQQLPVLESLWQRFAAEALRAKRADDKAKLLRAALQAQQGYARTFALLRALAAPVPAVTLHLGDAANSEV